MKIPSHLSFVRLAALAAVLTFGIRAYAQTPREEITHAYRLLSTANGDYAGHRAKAMEELQAAAKIFGIEIGGQVPTHEQQWKSDQQLNEAHRLLTDARIRLEKEDRERIAGHVDTALKEIEEALSIGQSPRQQLKDAYRLVTAAKSDYAGHRVKAVAELEAAGKALGLELNGELQENERQWKSDEQMAEARRLLESANARFAAGDRTHIAGHVDIAIKEINEALTVK